MQAVTMRLAVCTTAVFLVCPAVASTPPIALPYQLTHSIVADPSFSPDGKRMVYITVVAGKEQLFTANIDGSASVQVTHDEADHEDPAWSPGGTTIAYVTVAASTSRIYLMDIDGSHRRPLTASNMKVIHPHWSPDGKRLAYCTTDDLDPPRKNAAEIQEIDLAARKARVLVTGGINTYPAYSPDGSKIAFRKFVGENSEVFTANADGSGPKNITNSPAFDGWPAWSPDGSEIAFASNRNSSYQIFVMKPDGSDVRLVANTDGRATYPAWRRDGLAIYFSLCRNVDYGNDCQIFVAPMKQDR